MLPSIITQNKISPRRIQVRLRNAINSCLFIFIIIASFAGCKKFLAIDLPNTELVTGNVFNNSATATAAQTAIYSQMMANSTPYNIAVFTGLSGDELFNYSTYPAFVELYKNALNPLDNDQTQGLWSTAYNYIYEANAVLAALQNNGAISPAVQQQLTGESLFIRAFWHFYLTNLYGDVPLILTTNYQVNAVASRTPKAQVYQQIIVDLKNAQNSLSSNYVDANDTSITTDRIRPTKWAAAALLARVYLYTNDYAEAQTAATQVINNAETYTLVNNLDSVFLANSNEAIWQMEYPQPNNINTPEGYYFILTGPPMTNVDNSTTISIQLLNSFEPGDNRKTHWITYYSLDTDTFYYPFKYKVYQGTPGTEYEMVLRLTEQFLIRAEAEAQQSDLTDAAADLNIIRKRAGLGNTTANSQAGLLSAILHERQVELFTEWGHRWLDLNRTGNASSVMGSVTPLKGGSWSPNWELYPIPQSDRTNDPNLTQNLGY